MRQCLRYGRDRRGGECDECSSGPSSDRGVPIPQIMERVRQRTTEQIIDVHVRHVVEGVQVVQIIPSERAVTDCQCASTSDLEEIVNVVWSKSATTDHRATVDVLNLRMLVHFARAEENV